MRKHTHLFWLFLAILLATSTPATAPAAPPAPAPAFEFLDLRVQKTNKAGDKNHARFKSGQQFYVAWYVRIVRPPVHDNELTFTYTVTPVGEEAGKRMRSSAKVPAGYHDGVFRCGGASLTLAHRRKKTLHIKAQVAMNGITRTRTTTITIVP